MSFVYKGQIEDACGGRVLRNILLADSTEFTVGECVKYDAATGTAILWGAGGAGAGIIVSFVKADGSPVTDNGSGSDFVDTYTTPSSNTVLAVVDVSKTSQYSVPADANLGTTSGSDKDGVNLDLVAASDQLDESSVQNAGTAASFHSWGVDPDPKAPSNSLLVTIQESQVQI
jgi:hypothetical protein